ncbi:hypothetical protein [Phreatobacter stygius]|uniref:Uncharacterized protein n=1 Tax=Phreatobacter stygius TaxID=1940610 RepID=A0A4D7B5F0_9HYPH|nr:hypothetical protein [Phreatobacter stygius]QCI65648.1 hypothetical protein E8M01_16395 [Phreatobacter stygius]
MTPEVEDFTEALQPIAAEVGVDAARALVTHFGGTRLYVPKIWRDSLDLNVIGVDAAKDLCRLFGPEKIDIPKVAYSAASLQRLTLRLRGKGLSNAEIARAVGLSWRTVTRYTHRAPLPAKRQRATDPRQIDIEDLIRQAG